MRETYLPGEDQVKIAQAATLGKWALINPQWFTTRTGVRDDAGIAADIGTFHMRWLLGRWS